MLYSANLSQPDLAETARIRFAGKTAEQLKRLERLIQDVLLFARGEQIGRDLIRVASLIADVAQTMAPLCDEKGVRFRVTAEAGDSMITGSRKALGGALLNLLENALQACEGRGMPGGEVWLDVSRNGTKVRIGVRDTGVGIAPEAQARIFEPFFTTRGQGTGLGLAIALGVVRAHGGTIEVRSVHGEGSEFVMVLPTGEDVVESFGASQQVNQI